MSSPTETAADEVVAQMVRSDEGDSIPTGFEGDSTSQQVMRSVLLVGGRGDRNGALSALCVGLTATSLCVEGVGATCACVAGLCTVGGGVGEGLGAAGLGAVRHDIGHGVGAAKFFSNLEEKLSQSVVESKAWAQSGATLGMVLARPISSATWRTSCRSPSSSSKLGRSQAQHWARCWRGQFL
jgi:hypothetical protein